MKYVAAFAFYVVLGPLLVILITHSYPHRATKIEHMGILNMTVWHSKYGDCGQVYARDGGYHAFVDALGGPGITSWYPTKEEAYAAVEWWCRP